MPGSYLIDEARRLVFSRGWGVLTDDELHWHAETLAADPRFDPGHSQVVDFRDLSEIQVTAEGIRCLAHMNPFRRDSRRAVIAPDDVSFGLTRMFEILTQSDPDQFRVFRTVGPALEWVGLDATTPWPADEPNAVIGAAR